MRENNRLGMGTALRLSLFSSEVVAWIGLESPNVEEQRWIDDSAQFYDSACPYTNWNYDYEIPDERGCGEIREGLWIIVETCDIAENTYWAVCNSFVVFLFSYSLVRITCVHVV